MPVAKHNESVIFIVSIIISFIINTLIRKINYELCLIIMVGRNGSQSYSQPEVGYMVTSYMCNFPLRTSVLVFSENISSKVEYVYPDPTMILSKK